MHLLYGVHWSIPRFLQRCAHKFRGYDNGEGYGIIAPFIFELHKKNNIDLTKDEIKEINDDYVSFFKTNKYKIKYTNFDYVVLNNDYVFYGIEIKQMENTISLFNINNLVSKEEERKMHKELSNSGFHDFDLRFYYSDIYPCQKISLIR